MPSWHVEFEGRCAGTVPPVAFVNLDFNTPFSIIPIPREMLTVYQPHAACELTQPCSHLPSPAQLSPAVIYPHLPSSHLLSSTIICPALACTHLPSPTQLSPALIYPHLPSSQLHSSTLTCTHLPSSHLIYPHLPSSHLHSSTLTCPALNCCPAGLPLAWPACHCHCYAAHAWECPGRWDRES